MAVAGIDLRPLWQTLIAKLIDGTIEAGEGLDLSLIAQLLGDKPAGLAIQHEILASHQLFRSPCAVTKPRLRVLALAAATDMGSNTPIEFLLEQSDIELMTLYVIPEIELPVPLPDHDIAIVIASDSWRLPRCAAQDRSRRAAMAASAAQSAAVSSAISIATSCIACSTELPVLRFRRRSLLRASSFRSVAIGRRMSRHRDRSCISRHCQAARIACRRRSCEAR